MNIVESKVHNTFIREFDIDVISQTLVLHQKLEGDVNCVVWDAAIVLAKYLEVMYEKDNTFLRGKNVVELGAGLGCVGLVAACLGANVILTDLPEAMSLLEYNLLQNNGFISKGSAKACSIRWGSKINLEQSPDIVLLADCIYYEESIQPLVQTLLDCASSETEIILTQEMRHTDKQKRNWQCFLDKIKEHFRCVEVPLEKQHPDYNCSYIKLHKFYKK